jgi:hypothetical protein
MNTLASVEIQDSVNALSLLTQAIDAARPGLTHQLRVHWNLRRAQQLVQRLGIRLERSAQDEKFFCETFYNPGGLEDLRRKKTSDLLKAIQVQESIISDIEGLYETASSLIDLWAVMCGSLAGFRKDIGFNEFVRTYIDGSGDATSEPGIRLLARIRNVMSSDLCWLNNHIKIMRNKFVVHYDQPWQQSIHFDAKEMRLSFELYLAFKTEEERDKIRKEVISICEIGPKHLRLSEADSYPHATILSHCLDHIDEFEKSARDRLSEIARSTGFIGPTSQTIVDRSCMLINKSVPILVEFVNEHQNTINLV